MVERGVVGKNSAVGELRIEGEALHAAAFHVRSVIDSLATAGADAHEAAEYVGHQALAGTVRNFADGWDVHRARYCDELRQVAALLEAVDDTFADLDRDTAARLRQTAAAAAPAHSGVDR